jgi:hypothetical protein
MMPDEDRSAVDEAEEEALHFFLALREGSIVPVGTNEEGNPVFDLTEQGWCRARAIATTLGVDKTSLTEAQAVGLVTRIAHGDDGMTA